MAAWQAGFQTANPEVTVNYDPVGSGGGREQFIAGGVDFAGSDAYLDDEEGELERAKERCVGDDPIEVPDYVSPIAVVYNLEGVDDLQLSAPRDRRASSTARSPSGTTRRSPRTTPTPSSRPRRSPRSTAPTTRAPRTTSPTT